MTTGVQAPAFNPMAYSTSAIMAALKSNGIHGGKNAQQASG